MEEYFALCGSVGLKKDIPLIKAKLPIKQILLDLILEIGLFGELSGELATEQKFSQEYRHVFNWNWSSKGASTLKNTNEFKPISGTYSGIVALDGHVRVGAYGKIGAEFIATKDLDIAEIDLRADGGWSLEGSFVPYKKDLEFAKKNTDLYKMIKDKNIGIYWFYGLSGEAKLFKWSISHEVPNICGIPLNRKEPIKELRVVPLFADTKLEKDDSGKYFASTKASGNVGKTELGMALVNRKNSDDATYTYLVQDYKGPEFKLNTSFSNMSADAEYIAYPLVKYLDMELLAEPSSDPQKTYIFPYIFYQKNAAGSMIGGSSVYDSFKGEESTYVITNDKNTVKESLK